MTYVFMVLFLALYMIITLAGIRYNPNRETFFDLRDTRMLRGIFCIIVVLVHVPEPYQNRLQDMAGNK